MELPLAGKCTFSRFRNGKPVGMNWQYDGASDKWTKMKDMPLPVHHSSLAEYHGKIYMFGGYILNTDPNIPAGMEPVDTRGNSIPLRTPGRRSRLCRESAAQLLPKKWAARFM